MILQLVYNNVKKTATTTGGKKLKNRIYALQQNPHSKGKLNRPIKNVKNKTHKTTNPKPSE